MRTSGLKYIPLATAAQEHQLTRFNLSKSLIHRVANSSSRVGYAEKGRLTYSRISLTSCNLSVWDYRPSPSAEASQSLRSHR